LAYFWRELGLGDIDIFEKRVETSSIAIAAVVVLVGDRYIKLPRTL